MVVEDFDADREQLSDYLQAMARDLSIEMTDMCENSLSAKEKIYENEPDIIISDIQMPYMDGLKFAEDIGSQFPNIKFIFCTLYDKFEYAQEAVRLHGAAFILKPVDPDELKMSLELTINDIKGRLLRDRELALLRTETRANLNMLRNSFYHDLVFGLIADKSELMEKLGMLSLEIEKCHTIMALVEIDDFAKIARLANVERPVITMKVLKLLRRFSDEMELTHAVRLDDSHFAYIRSFPASSSSKESRSAAAANCSCLIQMLKADGISATIAISEGTSDLMSLGNAYDKCKQQLRFKYTLGSGRIITSMEIPQFSSRMNLQHQAMLLEIRYLISSDDESATDRFISTIFSGLDNPAQSRCVAYSLTMNLLLALNEFGMEPAGIFGDSDVWESMMSFETVSSYLEWSRSIIRASRQAVSGEYANKSKCLVEKIKHFIRLSDLSSMNLQAIAAEFHYSPNHVNTVFKKMTGQTISDYLTEARIEKAKSMLSIPGVKLLAVATELGYSHAAHFNSLFKRHVGVTPREYRDGKRNVS
jgi:YesN/AraC family two-component response regulator